MVVTAVSAFRRLVFARRDREIRFR